MHSPPLPRPRFRGLTLVEILVVVAIVAGISAIAVPVIRSAMAKSREAACLGNLRGLGIALQHYLNDHNQTMPEMDMARSSIGDDLPVLETVLLPFLNDGAETFHCPEDPEQFAKTGSSYLWNPLNSGRHVSNLTFFHIDDRQNRIPLISDKEAWHPGGTNFLYADLSASNEVRFASGN